MNRSARALLAVALCTLLACATLVKADRASVKFRGAPADLAVFEDGHPVLLQQDGRAKVGRISYNTKTLTLQSAGRETVVNVETSIGVGWVIIDFVLYMFPMLIDFATGKWNSIDDIETGTAFAMAVTRSMPMAQGAPFALPNSAQGALAAPPLAAPIAPAPVAAAPTRTAVFASGKLAVLDFKSFTKELGPEQVRYFTDVVRDATVRATPKVQVMTRENLLVLLQASGRDAANCEGECEVDTGRRIGADAVVSGEILKVGTHFKLSLKLHDTKEGTLLSTAVASGVSIDELDESAQKAAIDLITPMR